jgi:antitoxin FitA
VQVRGIPDDTYCKLAQRAAEAQVTVPDYLRRLAERDASRPTVTEWIDHTRRRGGPVRKSNVVQALDELRGPWPADADR